MHFSVCRCIIWKESRKLLQLNTWKVVVFQYTFPANFGQTPQCIGNPFHLILWINEFLCNQHYWHVKWNGFCLMNPFKTQVPPGAVPFPLFYCLFIPMRLCATISTSFQLSIRTTQPKRPDWFQWQQKNTMIQSWQTKHKRKEISSTAKNSRSHPCLTPPRASCKQQAGEVVHTCTLMLQMST